MLARQTDAMAMPDRFELQAESVETQARRRLRPFQPGSFEPGWPWLQCRAQQAGAAQVGRSAYRGDAFQILRAGDRKRRFLEQFFGEDVRIFSCTETHLDIAFGQA